MPRLPHQPTPETRAEVEALASFGVTHDDIGSYIGINRDTLRKYYAQELKLAAINANAKVARYLLSLASGQALTSGASHAECGRAAMFWAKTRLGWRETDRLEHTGANGAPITVITGVPRSAAPARDDDGDDD